MYSTVLNLYCDKRSGVQGNTSLSLRELLRAQPAGFPVSSYFLVLPDFSQGTNITYFPKVIFQHLGMENAIFEIPEDILENTSQLNERYCQSYRIL